MTRLQQLLNRYLAGSTSPEETNELLQLLNEENNAEAQQLLNDLWNSPSKSLSQEKSNRILASILSSPQEIKVVPMWKKRMILLKSAAVVALLIAVGIGLYTVDPITRLVTEAEIATVAAESKFIKLPDGSRVILNNDSKIEYPNSFDGKSTREVFLNGEAFFDISHDQSKPFIVRTGKINTTVLGTAFNIKAYPDQSEITVTVTRGKVRVSNDTEVLGILSPDDQIVFNRNDQHSKVQSVKGEEFAAWTEKDIHFDNISMGDAMEELSERFNVQIKLKSEKIKLCRFTATFVRGEDIHQILDVICEFNQAEYSVADSGAIEISGAGCANED